jgi:arylformamidase
MEEVIDLSMTIHSHWRWQVNKKVVMDHQKGDPFLVSVLTLVVHAFTHVDTPLHMLPGKTPINAVPLNQLVGPSAVLDLSFVDSNEAIRRKDLEKAGKHILPGDIVLLKTGWDLKRDWNTREFWTESPYLEEGAAAWLAGQEIKAVGFDFPQDYAIRETHLRHPIAEEMPTHHFILRKGIYLIEYLCNLHRIKANRVKLFVLPLKIEGAEAAPARVVAVMS